MPLLACQITGQAIVLKLCKEMSARTAQVLESTNRLSQYPHSTQPVLSSIDSQTRGCPNAPSPPSHAMRVEVTTSVSGGGV